MLYPSLPSYTAMPCAHSLNGMDRYTTPSLDESVESEKTAYLAIHKPYLKVDDDFLGSNELLVAMSSNSLTALLEKLKRLTEVLELRGAECERGVRLVQDRKDALKQEAYANEAQWNMSK